MYTLPRRFMDALAGTYLASRCPFSSPQTRLVPVSTPTRLRKNSEFTSQCSKIPKALELTEAKPDP